MATKDDRAILNCVFNPFLPFAESNEEIIPEGLKDEEEDTPVTSKAKDLELEAVKAAEEGRLEKAIDMFSLAINKSPKRPSAYNNRAQAYRLKGNISGAIQDLNNTINVSEGRGKSACLAYCQRGLIYRLQNDESKAKSDFVNAAKMGSQFAAHQLVQMNSYAALCNDMLNKVLGMYKKRIELTTLATMY